MPHDALGEIARIVADVAPSLTIVSMLNKRHTRVSALCASLFISACVAPPEVVPQTSEGVTIRHLEARSYSIASEPGARRRGATADGSTVSMALQAVDNNGKSIKCKASDIRVDVEVSTDDGKTYRKIDKKSIELACSSDAPTDIALVLDNSGSQQKVLDETKRGAKSFATAVLNRKGRVSVTRVTTQAVPMLELGDDRVEIYRAIDSLFVGRGWTALYDGVRRGHESLGKVLGEPIDEPNAKCQTKRRGAVVLMTNGTDNNSADEQLADDSDGFATTVEELKSLNIQGVKTPVFTIGLGKEVDEATLKDLAQSTGGRYIGIDEVDGVGDAFKLLDDFLGDTVEVCADLPPTCGPVKVRVHYQYDHGQQQYESTEEYTTLAECPVARPEGRAATVLLTLTNPGIPSQTRDLMLKNTVDWVSAVDDPAVLIVRDDNHHNEYANEVSQLRDRLRAAGFATTMMNEPENGLLAGDIADYDVVWFSNPGWPMDDVASYTTLQSALADGIGVVLSGDDMSWSMGNSFSMSSITHLTHSNNGTSACGTAIDNNAAGKYTVTFENGTHPMLSGLAKSSFFYGDDIDQSVARGEGEEVLAWASFDGGKKCQVKVPVVVAYDPSAKR
jgi:hypothetical protein